jgi:acyl-coenzyme A synthetase/AMP-(fatty) acid ligase/acyl carrier protein
VNLVEELFHRIRESRGLPFLITAEHTFSYSDLSYCITNLLPQLKSCNAGDRVLIVCSDDLLASAAFLACMSSGVVPVILPSTIPATRLNAIFKTTDAVAVITDGSQASLQDEPCTVVSMSRLKPVSWLRRFRASRARIPVVRVEESESKLAYLLFTSGTTDEPAGIEITYGALRAQLVTLRRLFDFGPGDRIANSTPLAHTDGLVQGLLLTVYSGAALIRQGPLVLHAIDAWMNQIVAAGATHFITNPTVLRRLVKGTEHSDYFRSSNFRCVISSAATLSAEFWLEFEGRFSCDLFNIYGMTETVANATYAGNHPEMGAVGTIGKPIDCSARLRDLSTGELTTTEIGEIELSGNNICRSYWRNDERNKTCFTPDQWLKSGDLARWREDGSLEFIGRVKAVIMSGGLTLSPDEVDEVMMRHSGIKESVTLGIPHDDFEEIAVTACVVSAVLSETELLEHARASLEPLKVPKRVICFESELPRGLSGKPDLVMLRRLILDMLDAEFVANKGRLELAEFDDSDPEAAENLYKGVMRLAARVFGIPKDELTIKTSADDLDVWDSFNHLNLILEAESQFSVSFSTSTVLNIKSLAHLADAIIDARS